MKKSIKVNLGGNLQGLSNKNGNYRSIYKGSDFPNPKDIILNPSALNNIFQTFQKKENLSFPNHNQILKLIDNSLKIYLKNIIQELIQHNRRRTYPRYLSFTKNNRIISYGINVQRDADPEINKKKNKLYPQKNITLMRTINVDKKLELLDRYNMINKNKKLPEPSPKKEIEDKAVENSESSESDFFHRKKSKDSEDNDEKSNNSINNNKNEYQGILNVYQSHELTSNKLYAFKKPKMGNIELKDLIYYLEENQTIPLNKQLLYKAYIDMTLPKDNKENEKLEEDMNDDLI